MIERFLRWPRGASETIADLLRVIGLLSVVTAAIFFQATDAGVLAFVLPGLLLPRFVGVPEGFDIAYCSVLLVAAWSNVFDLYTSVPWWDIPVHFCCTGVIAAMLYLLLARVGVAPAPTAGGTAGAATGEAAGDADRATAPAHGRATVVVLVTAFGLAVSALWEMVEWFGHAVISPAIFVEYNDTIGDMAVGGLGSLLAGTVLALALARTSAALGGAGRSA